MDYTKFLNNKNNFKLNITDTFIKDSIVTLKNIKKAEYILLNHNRFSHKIEIDEYFAYFLKEKNGFIKSFQQYIISQKNNPEVSEDHLTVYKEVLNILKSNLDNLITNFKIIKQNIYKKTKQQELFNEHKFNFFADLEEDHSNDKSGIPRKNSDINNQSFKARAKAQIKKIIPIDFDKLEEGIITKFQETNTVIHMMMDKEKQNYEKTKRILYDLSSLNSTIQKKLFEQSEMTKNILFNSFKSVDNIEQGNKHLTKAKEYQKGRGLTIGLIFIILGLFLIISDR
jgi:hypothetical protein